MRFHKVSLASRAVGTLNIPGALRPGSEGGNQPYLAKAWGCQTFGGIRFCGKGDLYRVASHKKSSRRKPIRSDIATGQGGTQQQAVGVRTAGELCSAQWISRYRGFTQKQCNEQSSKLGAHT